jgi:hypothetical protein
MAVFMAPGQKIKQFRPDVRQLCATTFFSAHLSPSLRDMDGCEPTFLAAGYNWRARNPVDFSRRSAVDTHTRLCFCSIRVYKLC